MRARQLFAALTLGTMCVTVSACSSQTTSPSNEGTYRLEPIEATGSPEIVQIAGDYPSYDAGDLVDASTLIVEGTVIDTQPTELKPRFEGDTPEENPLLGLSEEERVEAEANAESLPATEVTFRADVVHRGNVETGQDIRIVQTGGQHNGVLFTIDGEVPLEVGKSYLLFAEDGFDGTFVILGGSAGTFQQTSPGQFIAAAPDMAPFSDLTTEQVQSLLGGAR